MRHDIPEFLWKIGSKVENLIQQYDVLERWREHVRRWSPSEGSPTDLVKTLYSRSLDAKYAILAAIHDLCFEPDQVPAINPWPIDLPLEAAKAGIGYVILKLHLLPDAEAWHRGLDVSDSDRLQIIFDEVARSVVSAKVLSTVPATGQTPVKTCAPIIPMLSPEIAARLNTLSLSAFKVAWCCDPTRNIGIQTTPSDFLVGLGEIDQSLKWAGSIHEQLPQLVRDEYAPLRA